MLDFIKPSRQQTKGTKKVRNPDHKHMKPYKRVKSGASLSAEVGSHRVGKHF